MGGYAPYVWGSWGIVVAVLAGNWWAVLRAQQAALRAVRAAAGQ